MNFRGKVVDQAGQPLVGAHIVTINTPKKGTITDFDGIFEIGDAFYGQAWEVAHIGYKSQVFVIDRNVPSKTFFLEEDALALDEFVGYPTVPRTPPYVGETDPYVPGLPTTTIPGYSDSFQDYINQLPKKPQSNGFWDSLKSNPAMAFAFGLVAIFAGGWAMKEIAKKSDGANKKRLAKT